MLSKHKLEEINEHKEKFLKRTYRKHYKKLLIIPILMLVLAIAQIGLQITQTGDFINKGVSLKGGLTISIDKTINVNELSEYLNNKFPQADLLVRELSKAGKQVGVVVEASDVKATELVQELEQHLQLEKKDYNVEVMGSSLGESFFRETFKALILAFLVMGIVVFLYFGKDTKSKIIAVTLTLTTMIVIYLSKGMIMNIISLILILTLMYIYLKYSVPSFAVILAAFSDIVVTLAIVNLMGMRLSTSGIAAFLMLIGYSVDTDILLSTKVLKQGGDIIKRIWSAMRTGLMMSATTIVAVTTALIFTQSDILKQIMIIILIGLVVDLINTWIQNAGILRLYLERKNE